MVRSAVIVDALRTPLGKRNGKLKGWHPVELAALTLRALAERNDLDPAMIDDVIMGCVSQVGEQGFNIGRNAVLAAGFPESVPSTSIDRQCGSSQQAAHFAAQGVIAGAYDIAIAAGVEVMSRVPMGASVASGPGMPFSKSVIERYASVGGLQPQGIGAEMIADRWNISRDDCDAFSVESHRRAAVATAEGRFEREILPVEIVTDSGPETMTADEGFRPDASMESLAKLKPAFKQDGKITAANSSQITDGAAAVLIMSEEKAAELGLRNIDRVMPLLIPATTKLGGDYVRLREMYQALMVQRYRELAAVAKIVGGVEETRYQAGRGTVPFKPVDPAQQRAAVKFLLDRGWAIPRALLDREVLRRIGPSGGADALQGSNVQLLRQVLDPGVFQRLAEARHAQPTGKGYVGMDLLVDLNDGLFQELHAKRPVIELYRRELQRNYVTLLLVATGATNDPQGTSASIEMKKLLDDGSIHGAGRSLNAARDVSSPLADVAKEYRRDRGRPSEFRSSLRFGVAHLYAKLDDAIKRSKDPDTLAHLRDLRSELGKVP